MSPLCRRSPRLIRVKLHEWRSSSHVAGSTQPPLSPPHISAHPMWTLHKLKLRQSVNKDSPVLAMERAGPDGFDTGTRSQNATSSARDGAERTSSSPRSPDWIKDDGADFSSHFATEDLDRFPALKKRNFFCVQRHQATG